MNKFTPQQKSGKLIPNTLNLIGVKENLDAPMLYISRQTDTKILTKLKLFDIVKEAQGLNVECGVYKAKNLATLFHMPTIFESFFLQRKIMGCYTFKGI